MKPIILSPAIHAIVEAIARQGGRALLVGGAVRDHLLDLPVKDIDIEVHGLTDHQLEEVLGTFGYVSTVGKSFGVLRVADILVDWSLPRADSAGRKPAVAIDPFMNLVDAFRRRDITINAMGIDLVTHELIDPFGGQADLKARRLRATDPRTFAEDPLRFFRVMQFIGRFQMTPDAELNSVCADMDITAVSRERIEQEFIKLFTYAARPSLGIGWLHQIGRLSAVLPELADTIGIVQDARWHPEGDVFAHTLQTIDAAAGLTLGDQQLRIILVWAALCHDLGKVSTTVCAEDKITSYGHEEVGACLARTMMRRVTHNQELIATVCLLVRHHMSPVQFVAGGAKAPAYKRLARKLAPYTTLRILALLSLADQRGRNPVGPLPLDIAVPEITEFMCRAQELKVQDRPEEPVLQGRDLLDIVAPGPELGKLVQQAYEIQIEKGITDKDELRRRVLSSRLTDRAY